MRKGLLAFVLVGGVSVSCPALAQSVSPGDASQETARAHFEAASAEAERGNYDVAAGLFRRSLDAFPQAVTAYNLSLVLESAQRPLQALELVEAILGGDYGPISGEGREDVHALRERAAAAVSTLRLSVAGVGAAQIQVDGSEFTLRRDQTIGRRMNPGQYEVVAVHAPRRIVESVALDPGEIAELTLRFPAEPSSPAPAPESGSPWPWILGLAGAVLVGAGVLVAVLLATSGTNETGPDVYSDPVTGIAFTLADR